jgi:NADPH-dependent 2,4-dienoyl-CoA reductase/sulfur reductase-like enzyme
MVNYKYLIVGGGMTANAGVKGIRQIDLEGSIGLVSAESHPPYNRPPLSKDVWGQIKAARQLIAQSGPFRHDDLKGRLLEAH